MLTTSQKVQVFFLILLAVMVILIALWGNGNIGDNHPPPNVNNIVLNFMASPTDLRDYQLRLPSTTNLPLTVDLSASASTVKNQGNFGSCTAFAGVACMEYIYKKSNPTVNRVEDRYSERFTYYTTRQTMGILPNNDSGAYIRDVIRTLVNRGSCLEASCPYMPYDRRTLTEAPSAAAYAEAQKYQILSYANIPEDQNKLANVKGALAAGYPIQCGFLCYQNLFSGKGGNIPLPQGSIIGGHAISIFGYDEAKQVFKFKNSWGSSWGDRGYGYLPFAYLTTGKMFDMWIIYTQEDNNIAIGIQKPGPDTKVEKLKGDILGFVAKSDLKSFAKIQSDIETTIINTASGLSPSDISNLKAFATKIVNALQ